MSPPCVTCDFVMLADCIRRAVLLFSLVGLAELPVDTWAAFSVYGAQYEYGAQAALDDRPRVSDSQTSRDALERGEMYLRQGRTAEAIATLKQALALDPRSALAHQKLAEAYLQEGSYEMVSEARAELQQAIALDPTLVWARFHLARLYLDFGEAAKGREQLDEAVKQRPDVPHLHSLLGEAERQLGRAKESIPRQDRALQLDPAFTPAHYYRGLALLDLDERATALDALETAAASNLPIPDLYSTLGSVYEEAGRLDRARILFERAVQIAPARPEGRLRLATLQRRQGDPAGALAALSDVFLPGTRLLPTQYYQQLEADVHLERGRALQDLKRWSEAAHAYTEAIALMPDLGEAHRQLAEVRYSEGRFRQALEHAHRAAALGHPVAPELVARLTELAGSKN